MAAMIQQDNKKITYILGNQTPILGHGLNIGRFYALDGSLGAPLQLDVSKPHVILIAGKRGYGKSYTMGVILEEFARLHQSIRNQYSCIVIDTLGIYWTLAYPNMKQEDDLKEWNKSPESTPITFLHTAKSTPNYYKTQHHQTRFQLAPNSLTSTQWCQLFQLSPLEPEGMMLTRAILELQENKSSFSLEDIKKTMYGLSDSEPNTFHVVENLLTQANSWNLFSKNASPLYSIIKPGEITIIDLSFLESTHLKQTVTGIISEFLFYYRINQRKNEEYQHITQQSTDSSAPYIWLAIDEAHLFLPQNQESFVKTILLHNWLRQGRQPGLSVILATQRPSFMDQEVLSHCDLVFCHRLTAQEDIQSLTRLRPTYMKGSIEETITQIGSEKGVALIIDDVVESAHIIRIRPRYSWHGGGEPIPIAEVTTPLGQKE